MRRIDRPWGYELFWAENALYHGKTLMMLGGKSMPRQHHQVRDKTLRVQKGTVKIEFKNSAGILESLVLDPGESCRLESGTEHKIYAVTDAEIIEVSTPDEEVIVVE